MFTKDNQEERIKRNEKKIQEIAIHFEALDQQTKDLFHSLEITPEELSKILSNKELFSKEQWSFLQEQKKLLEEKLKREQANIRDSKKNEKSFSDLKIEPHWLHVK